MDQINNGGITSDTAESEIEMEMDEETSIALRIASDLKEETLKQKFKDVLFNRFKSQLLKKQMLEKMFRKIERQIIDNQLDLRASKFFVFRACLWVVRSYFFNLLVLMSITGNTIVLAMDKYPSSTSYETNLQTANLAFFLFFAFELVVKLGAYGFRFYFKDKFNWFDCFVVLASAIDVGLTYSNISNTLP